MPSWESVRFCASAEIELDILNGLGAYVPTPSYYVNFSTDQHLGTNSLAGANFDATWSLAGNANSISALHFRYDTINKAYLAFEQHLSGSKAYAVFSLNPITRPNKFWDLILSDQPSDRFQVKTFTQMNTFQHGLAQPSVSSQFTTLQATQALTQSFLQLNAELVNYSMLANGGSAAAVPNFPAVQHPTSISLSATTFNHQIAHLPLYERLSYGFGLQHNSYGLQTLGGVVYPTIWQHNVDLQAFIPQLKLGGNPIITKNYYVNFSVEKNRQWNSLPHYIDTTTTNLSLSKTFDAHFMGFLSESILNTGDYYGALQSAVYPSYVPVAGGNPYPGYAAFNGFATLRTLSLDLTYTNNGNFSASFLARQHRDFPAAYPGLAPVFETNVLGQSTAPSSLSGRTSVRLYRRHPRPRQRLHDDRSFALLLLQL